MPDTVGMPTAAEVGAKLLLCAPDEVPKALLAQIRPVLAAVKAEFQRPVGRDGSGGTGRRFEPIAETRTYDGNGYARLRVDDIVPGAALSVSLYGSALTDVVLEQAQSGLGYNVLARPQSGNIGSVAAFAGWGVFPQGIQNIAVTTTFGYAAIVPADVCEAILGEVVSRLLSQGFVGVAGAGETVTMVDFEVNTSAGVSIWGVSSPIATLHTIYVDTVEAYREKGDISRARRRMRMS
jgi:hypothetical protein